MFTTISPKMESKRLISKPKAWNNSRDMNKESKTNTNKISKNKKLKRNKKPNTLLFIKTPKLLQNTRRSHKEMMLTNPSIPSLCLKRVLMDNFLTLHLSQPSLLMSKKELKLLLLFQKLSKRELILPSKKVKKRRRVQKILKNLKTQELLRLSMYLNLKVERRKNLKRVVAKMNQDLI